MLIFIVTPNYSHPPMFTLNGFGTGFGTSITFLVLAKGFGWIKCQCFDVVKLKNNHFSLPAFGVCMEATAATSAATLKLSECNNKRLQDFKWDNHGRIYLDGNTKLCVTIAKGKARNGGGGSPVHKIRNLSMEFCGADMSSYQIWATRKVK